MLQNTRYHKGFLCLRRFTENAADEKFLRAGAVNFASIATLCSANAVRKKFAQNASRKARGTSESIKNERISAK